jgi:hypothetical protein
MNARFAALAACVTLAVSTVFGAPGAQVEIPDGREVVLSEFPILPAPGPAGTWVELYNRSDRTVDIGKALLVCSGKTILEFPDSCPVPARSLLLVTFTRPHGDPWRVEAGPGNTQLATASAIVPSFKERVRVRAGFLSLEIPVRNARHRVADYVRWGRVPASSDVSYEARTRTVGLLSSQPVEPIYVGIADVAKPIPCPKGDMLLSRLSFDPAFDCREAWTLLDLDLGTPGSASRRLPSPSLDVEDGSEYLPGKGIPVTCSLPFALPSAGLEKSSLFRFELARDPYFEDAVGVVEIHGPTGTIPAKMVPRGLYYLRCQWARSGVETPWTVPVSVRVR